VPIKLLEKLKPFDDKSGSLRVIIDTPKGCRNKYAFDLKHEAYVLKAMLPRGAVFPFDLIFHQMPG
jgi:inorganic pyrophosphatase